MRELERRTGVGREAIRFYIKQGLLPEPERPRGNVAAYSAEHVRRIGLIRRLQAERNLSLGAIKALIEQPAAALAEGFPGIDLRLLESLDLETGEAVDLDEACQLTGFSREELEGLVRLGVVRTDAGGARLGPLDLAIAGVCARARRAGFGPQVGFYGEDLQLYVDVARQLAAREAGRFFARTAGAMGPEAAAEHAAVGLSLANELLGLLHSRAVMDQLGGAMEEARARPGGPVA